MSLIEAEKLEQLSELVSAKRKILASQSIENFVKIYLPHLTVQKSPLFHSEILSLLQEEKNRRLLFIAPRGFAKSTLCSLFYPLWLALLKKRQDIFLVSATMSLAKEIIRKIRNEIENNELILRDFGELKSDKWTEEFLILSNGVAIRGKGRGFQIRGFRPDEIICDDLEDEEVIYSKEQRDKLDVWFARTLLPALKPDQNLVYVGTKLHQFSLISKLQQKSEFLSRHYQALVDNKSIWEELWPTNRLFELRKELGEYAFQAEYQNNPISLEDQPIKFEYLDGVKIAGKPNLSCLAVDPAVSIKETSDCRAFSLFCRTDEGFREIFSERGRWSISDQIKRIIDLYKTYKPDRIVIESVAFQKVFKDQLIKDARKEKLWLPVSEAEMGRGDDKRPKDKFTRLLSIAHLFEQRLVEVKNQDLFQELLAFPFGDSDDMVDATVHSLYWLMKYQSGGVNPKRTEERLNIETKKSPFLVEVRPGVWETKYGDPPPIKINKSFISYDKAE